MIKVFQYAEVCYKEDNDQLLFLFPRNHLVYSKDD